jgi:predicted Fe-Mo cluster-binding NifX family protein
MKAAIAVNDRGEDALISSHFGQSSFFLIYDEDEGKIDFIENPGKSKQGCVGEAVVRNLVELGVKRVIAGDFGTLVQQLLNASQVQMILYPMDSGSAKDIITLLKSK